MKQAIGFLQYSSEYICFSAISESDKEKLLEEGYLASFFPSCVYAIDCKIFNHPHHGIGIRNINGGVEFLNFNNMKDPISLHKEGFPLFHRIMKARIDAFCFLPLRIIWHTKLL